MPCTDKNPLLREGTSLLDRVLAALSTSYAKVDERQAADIILFARRYAPCLNYYNNLNAIDGNWQPLMKTDLSVALAILSRINVQEISDYKKSLYKEIKLATNDADSKRYFKYLFDVLFSLVTIVDEQYKLLTNDFEYKYIIRDIIKNSLQYALADLEACFNNFKAANLLDYTLSELDNAAPVEVVSNKDFKRSDLSPDWQTAVADISITLPILPDARSVILYITNHNLFNAQLQLLLNGISSLVTRANDLFVQTLGDYPTHTPHYALFLAFVQIFSHAQDELNNYTQRHLDFYYKDVLQLINGAPQPDSAHVLFGLQKTINQDLVTANTLFKGGKDITGKDINYALVNDVVINKATVSLLHSSQIIHAAKDLLKASPIANSDDGQKPALTSADKSWFTYGDVNKIQNAAAGFAIASNILYMNEGTRTVVLIVEFQNAVPGLSAYLKTDCFTGRLTGKKGWVAIQNLKAVVSPALNKIEWGFTLTPDDQAIIPYDEKIHQQQMAVTLPVLEIFLNQDANNAIPYDMLCHQEIIGAEILIEVKAVTDLMLSSDAGAIDASKPFKPFGDFPNAQAGFYMGSKEIFQKNLASLNFNFDWKSGSSAAVLNTTIDYLRQNSWNNHSFKMASDAVVFSGANTAFTASAIDFTPNDKLTATTLEGFVRIKNSSSAYSQAAYLDSVRNSVNQTTVTQNDNTFSLSVASLPIAQEISLNAFSIDYLAYDIISFEANAPSNNNLFFHLGPFGYNQVNKGLIDNSPATENTVGISLLQDIIHDGELFVGLVNAEPDTVVTILFGVAEGSSNPLKDMEQVSWYYLAVNNNWKQFTQEQIIDSGNNFTQSGIVTLSLPDDISSENTLLEPGFCWIKATVDQNTDAVCKMIMVQAQAGLVQLVQDDGKQIEFRQTLPEGMISKLLVSDAAVKTITQPFDSFDGRIRESDPDFYVRVSERLRHKQRAITIWDYEHIILQQFQQIFKVKCLNQTGFYKNGAGDDVFCENYPGHVTIIPLPNLQNKTNINPLRPYTPIGILNNINNYLLTVISPFVKLHVKCPQFEEIQLDFKVQFYPHHDESFFIQQLNLDIEKFLCPWAYSNDVEISFEGKIIKSVLLNFVEERPYVDYVTCFKMDQIISRNKTVILEARINIEEAVPSTSRSMLVSYYDADNNIRHLITSPATCDC